MQYERMQAEWAQPQYHPAQYQQQQYPQPQYQWNKYPQQQQYPPQRGVGPLEVEDSNQESDLVKEEAKLYSIIVGSQDTFPDIFKVLQKIVHIVKHLITLLNNSCNLLWNGRLELSLIPTQCRIQIQTPIQIFRWFMSN